MTDDTAATAALRAQASELHPQLTITRQLLEAVADASSRPDQWIDVVAALTLAVGQLETAVRGLKTVATGEQAADGITGGILPS